MGGNGLGLKGQNLSAAFFARDEEEIGQLLREREDAVLRDLAEASGIDDEWILVRLTELGIRADTLAALTLVPLVEVAWADGRMDPRERAAILDGAAATGIAPGSWSYRLLDMWTRDLPAPELLEVWEDFIGALVGRLEASERARFKGKLLGRAREVAEAAAGVLGLGPRVSDSEARILSRLDEAFEDSGPA